MKIQCLGEKYNHLTSTEYKSKQFRDIETENIQNKTQGGKRKINK